MLCIHCPVTCMHSSLHLALLLNAIGKYKHTSQRNFGWSTVHIDQTKALLHSIGCKPITNLLHSAVLLSYNNYTYENELYLIIHDLQAWTFIWLHLFCYNLWDVCSGTNSYCKWGSNLSSILPILDHLYLSVLKSQIAFRSQMSENRRSWSTLLTLWIPLSLKNVLHVTFVWVLNTPWRYMHGPLKFSYYISL